MNICEGLSDLILERKTGTLQYIHITSPEYLDNIYLEGLRKSSGKNTNFGIDVIYVVNKSDLTSIKALVELSKDYTCNEEDTDFAIIHGTYDGEYYECIGADENELFSYNIGFIGLLNEDKSIIEKHDIIKGHNVESYILNQYLTNTPGLNINQCKEQK